MQLIQAYSSPLDLDVFQDDYENALREMIEAKQKDVPLPAEDERPAPTKVINLMDALRKSVSQVKKPVASERRTARKGPVLVGASKRKHKAA
jgi:DNA end-binding protein Ku